MHASVRLYATQMSHKHKTIVHAAQETTAPSAWSSTQAQHSETQGESRTTISHLNPVSKGYVDPQTRP